MTAVDALRAQRSPELLPSDAAFTAFLHTVDPATLTAELTAHFTPTEHRMLHRETGA